MKKPIKGYEGSYEVDDQGCVWSLKRGRSRKLVPIKVGLPRRYYAAVNLYRDGTHKVCKIGVLVLEAFVGPRPLNNVARHLNDDAWDNRLENMAWGTHSQNVYDARKNGRRNNKLTRDDVCLIKTRLNAGETAQAVSEDYPVGPATVRCIRQERLWGAVEPHTKPKWTQKKK